MSVILSHLYLRLPRSHFAWDCSTTTSCEFPMCPCPCFMPCPSRCPCVWSPEGTDCKLSLSSIVQPRAVSHPVRSHSCSLPEIDPGSFVSLCRSVTEFS